MESLQILREDRAERLLGLRHFLLGLVGGGLGGGDARLVAVVDLRAYFGAELQKIGSFF